MDPPDHQLRYWNNRLILLMKKVAQNWGGVDEKRWNVECTYFFNVACDGGSTKSHKLYNKLEKIELPVATLEVLSLLKRFLSLLLGIFEVRTVLLSLLFIVKLAFSAKVTLEWTIKLFS